MTYKRTDLQSSNCNRLFRKENNGCCLQCQVKLPKAAPGRASAKYNSVSLQYSNEQYQPILCFQTFKKRVNKGSITLAWDIFRDH